MPFHGPSSPWEGFPNYLKKEMSLVGEGTDISEKQCTLKQCTIGHNCQIGQRVKLNNCVIMDNVIIGDK